MLAVALCATAAVAIWSLVTGRFDATEARVLGSTMVSALLTLTGLAGATVLDRVDVRRALGQITIGLSTLDLALALSAIWSSSVGSTLGRAIGITSILLVASVQACLILGRLRDEDVPAVRALSKAAVGFTMVAALASAADVAFRVGHIPPVLVRLWGVVVVLAVLATLLSPIVRHLSRNQAGPTRCA